MLLGLLIGGAVLTTRGRAGTTETATIATAAPTDGAVVGGSTAVSAAPAATPTAALPTPATQATLPPPSQPTAVSDPPTAAAAATAAPVTATEPAADLRTILTDGIATGQVDKDGQDLLKKLDEIQQAIAKGDQKKASGQLRDLQKNVQEQTRKGKLDAELGDQVLAGISRIASVYGLDVSSGGKP